VLQHNKTVYEAWLLWIVGIPSENIPPFYSLKGSDFQERSCQVFFAHIRKVCSFLLCPEKPAELEQLRLLSTPSEANSNAYKAFQELFRKFPSRPGHPLTPKEAGRMPYRTMVDRINAYKQHIARRNVCSKGKQKKKEKVPLNVQDHR